MGAVNKMDNVICDFEVLDDMDLSNIQGGRNAAACMAGYTIAGGATLTPFGLAVGVGIGSMVCFPGKAS